MTLDRRAFVRGSVLFVAAAPAIVRAGSLMQLPAKRMRFSETLAIRGRNILLTPTEYGQPIGGFRGIPIRIDDAVDSFLSTQAYADRTGRPLIKW